jgi:hypothetical protein
VRKLFIVALFTTASILPAQQSTLPNAPSPRDWQSVQTLPAGASIHVKTQQNSASCKLKSADADSLACTGAKDLTLQRADIKSITIPRRGRSAAVMAGVGAGVGLATVKIVSSTVFGGFYNNNGGAKGAVWAGGAGAGALIFGGIGAATHPLHSTVYKAQ